MSYSEIGLLLSSLIPLGCSVEAHPRLKTIDEKCVRHWYLVVLFGWAV